jgi:TonB family protein
MKRTQLFLSIFCVIAASLTLRPIATARPYSDAERKAMFIRRTKPEYPYEALRRREEGRGLFRLHVDERGKVTAVTIRKSTGNQVLDSEGIRTFKTWRARPGERREVDVPLNFVLSGALGRDNGMGNDGLGIMKSRDR